MILKSLLTAIFIVLPVISVTAAEPDDRLFELRTYHAAAGRLGDLEARFRDHTTALFTKHGITNLAYFQPVKGQPGADTSLVYFIAHADRKAADASWDAFRADPDWTAAKEASEKQAGGSLTVPDGVVKVYLSPTDFSPIK